MKKKSDEFIEILYIKKIGLRGSLWYSFYSFKSPCLRANAILAYRVDIEVNDDSDSYDVVIFVS